jgi:hypothetical protein
LGAQIGGLEVEEEEGCSRIAIVQVLRYLAIEFVDILGHIFAFAHAVDCNETDCMKIHSTSSRCAYLIFAAHFNKQA